MLAMAAVAATLDALVEDNLMDRATEIHGQIDAQVGSLSGVDEVRGQGCLLGLKLDRPAKPVLDALRAHVDARLDGRLEALGLLDREDADHPPELDGLAPV